MIVNAAAVLALGLHGIDERAGTIARGDFHHAQDAHIRPIAREADRHLSARKELLDEHRTAVDVVEAAGHRGISACLAALNRLYRSERAFFEADFHGVGFEWVEVDNAEESIVAFVRKADEPRNALLFVFNFSAVSRPAHRLGVPYPVAYDVLFDSNDQAFGGPGGQRGRRLQSDEIGCNGYRVSLPLRLPALSALVLKPAPPDVAPLRVAGAVDGG
ncbi:MAG: hypothetical protein HC826_02450 [Rhodospirillales bacterium]|nr:hypothetical protein [Rhodospirillales bacterium]